MRRRGLSRPPAPAWAVAAVVRLAAVAALAGCELLLTKTPLDCASDADCARYPGAVCDLATKACVQGAADAAAAADVASPAVDAPAASDEGAAAPDAGADASPDASPDAKAEAAADASPAPDAGAGDASASDASGGADATDGAQGPEGAAGADASCAAADASANLLAAQPTPADWDDSFGSNAHNSMTVTTVCGAPATLWLQTSVPVGQWIKFYPNTAPFSAALAPGSAYVASVTLLGPSGAFHIDFFDGSGGAGRGDNDGPSRTLAGAPVTLSVPFTEGLGRPEFQIRIDGTEATTNVDLTLSGFSITAM